MKAIALTLSLVLAAAIPLALAQESPKAPVPDVAKLIDGLGAEDFNARKAAEKAILDLGEKAIPALEKAAKEHADAHVRLEAAKLLKKVSTAVAGEKPLAEPERKAAGAAEDETDRRLKEMIDRLEERGLLSEEQLERLRKMLEEGKGGMLGSGGAIQGRVMSNGRSIDFRRDAEGRIVVKVTENGETKLYEADSMEELAKTHPDVHALVRKHFGAIRIHSFGWPGDDWPPFPGFPRRAPRATPPEVPLRERPGVPAGFRMGIWIGEMSEALRVHLKLSKDEGVLVEEVVKGSLADRIGVMRLDVIRRVNGTPVGTAAAVRAVVEKIAEGGKVTLETIRKGDALTLVGTR